MLVKFDRLIITLYPYPSQLWTFITLKLTLVYQLKKYIAGDEISKNVKIERREINRKRSGLLQFSLIFEARIA